MVAKADTRNYDIFKGVVTVILLIIIAILMLQGRPVPEVEGPPEAELPAPTVPTVELALPVISLPTLGEDGSVSLAGTGQPGATVELWTGDVKLGEIPVGEDGAWSWDGTLDPGSYQLSARTVDASGQMLNQGSALALNVPEPAIEIALPAVNPPTLGEDGSISLSGTGQPGATVELWAGDVKLGVVPVGADGAWSWDGTLDPGDYQLSARTVDASGQMLNQSSALAFTVAAEVAPVIPVLTEPQVDAEGVVTLSGTAGPGAIIEIVEDGVVVGTVQVQDDGTWAFAYEAAEGTHRLTARSQAEPDVTSAEVDIEVQAKPAEGQEYVVQRGDSLAALAERFYGDWKLWRLIFEATNERAAQDTSYPVIENPRLIRPGWKLWIPAQGS